ncbi:PREDICTED: serine/arginine repetitive matrix protein 3 [Charadrius vociferus]|uniref:serine/arginine repetitive matrix protein 3 n=1 Tax=Charadrius vociferus TaxID=50402 RepID=UPI000521892D|nr:PREDICTED: serine/arginine repetitive matrix protein 3 [Charadrius vociferus]
MALYNNGADVPSPQEASNGFSQPGASGTWHKGEEEVRLVEPNLVKKAHREILDHERKRRVELKCMELQEMMEEQGYSEEEIRQKVGTFRQMLMEKEGVLTREDQHGRQIVIENHHGADGEEYAVEYPDYGEGCLLQCDCSAECYREDSGHREYRLKRRSSSSTSPPPKKKKKKKSGHRRSRKKRKPGSERSCDSSSPIRKEKKKKTGKKHRRDRSESGSRKKRRHREGREVASPSSPSPRRSASPHQNGHKGSAQNGRHSHGVPLPEPSDVRSAGSHPYHPPLGPDRDHGAHAKKVKERHHRGRPNSSSESSAKHSRHASERRKSPSPSPGQRSSSWSSSGSLSKSRSRSREKRAGRSRSCSPSPKKPASREKDNEPRTRHGDPDPTRARRRSRSYSPIRKRRRDSPSFMEPRRITRWVPACHEASATAAGTARD